MWTEKSMDVTAYSNGARADSSGSANYVMWSSGSQLGVHPRISWEL